MGAAVSLSKGRLLTLYALVWLTILLVGAGGLMALRQWGWARIEYEHAQSAFAEARDAFDRGDFVRAQRTFVRLIEAKPERLSLALATFDTDVLAMPSAAEAVANSEAMSQLPAVERARHVLVLQGADAALERLNAMATAGKADRDATLWHARVLLARAEFEGAKKRFDAYWSGHIRERDELFGQLTPGQDELVDRGASAADQLFKLGLWAKAATLAESARNAGAKDPALDFYIAVAAERNEGKAAAIKLYERVLDALPNHDLALRRLLRLSEDH